MLFRALFWIGFVALLAPRPPALGLGDLNSLAIPHIAIGAGTDVQFAHIGLESDAFIDRLRSDLFTRLRKVRTDIESADAIGHRRQQSAPSFF